MYHIKFGKYVKKNLNSSFKLFVLLIETTFIKLCKVIPIESYFIEFDLVPGCVKTLIIR